MSTEKGLFDPPSDPQLRHGYRQSGQAVLDDSQTVSILCMLGYFFRCAYPALAAPILPCPVWFPNFDTIPPIGADHKIRAEPDLLCLGNGDIVKKSMETIKIDRPFSSNAQFGLAA